MKRLTTNVNQLRQYQTCRDALLLTTIYPASPPSSPSIWSPPSWSQKCAWLSRLTFLATWTSSTLCGYTSTHLLVHNTTQVTKLSRITSPAPSSCSSPSRSHWTKQLCSQGAEDPYSPAWKYENVYKISRFQVTFYIVHMNSFMLYKSDH